MSDPDGARWIREQAERAQARLVNYKREMGGSNLLYFGTRRTTQSDVVSIVTTVKSFIDDSNTWNPNVHRPVPPIKNALYTSPLETEEIVERVEIDRRNRALWKEKDRFMAKLEARRLARSELEHDSASKLQRVARGFLMRMWLKANVKRLRARRKMKRSYGIIQRQIKMKLEMEENAKRAEEKREQAAITIQTGLRIFMARRAAYLEKYVRHIERLNAAQTLMACMIRKRFARRVAKLLWMRLHESRQQRAAKLLQSSMRGRLARHELVRRRHMLERIAYTILQRSWRRFLARRSLGLERERVREEVRNFGALDIQRSWRGHLGRKVGRVAAEAAKMVLKDAATLFIQRVFRGSIGRAIFRFEAMAQREDKRTFCAIQIQRIGRGKVGRVKAVEWREKLQTDIFYQARLGNKQACEDLFAGFGTETMYTLDSCNRTGNTVLLVACRFGHKKIAKNMLRKGMDLNWRNDKGQSAVMLAVLHGHGDLAEWLMSKKAKLKKYGRTVVMEGAKRGLHGVVAAGLHKGIGPNEQDPESGRTALHEVAFCPGVGGANAALRANVAQLLVEKGAWLDFADHSGQTALHFAASVGCADYCQSLIDMGADISIKDDQKRTAWRCALANGHDDTAQMLRANWSALVGETENIYAGSAVPDSDKKELLAYCRELPPDSRYYDIEAALQAGLPVDMQDDNGETLLMAAAAAGAVGIVSYCLQSGANVNLQDFEGRSAAHYSGNCADTTGEALLNAGADVVLLDKDARTPLHAVAECGKLTIAWSEALRKRGVRVDDLADRHGRTPLHLAADGAHSTSVRQLLTLQASPGCADLKGLTPLHLVASSVEKSVRACITYLTEAKASVDETSKEGRTALHVACAAGSVAAVSVLLDKGADASFKDPSGLTPCHLGASVGSEECLQALFNAGAVGSPEPERERGATPLYLALEGAHDSAVGLLLEHGADIGEVYTEPMMYTPLHVASRACFADGVRRIVEAARTGGILSDILSNKDDTGMPPLVAAVRSGAADAAQMLLDAGANPMLNEYVGDLSLSRTLLHVAAAASRDSRDLMQLLITRGFSPEETDAAGLCAAHHAAASGNAEVLSLLLDVDNASLEKADAVGRTPLHHAALSGAISTLKLLVDRFADQSCEDNEGLTPLQLASENDRDQAVEFLITGELVENAPDDGSGEGGDDADIDDEMLAMFAAF